MPGYDAFLSYSHAADSAMAADVQNALQRFATPWYRRKPFLRVQRDETSFGAGTELSSTLQSALDDSEHLIVLLSPEAAASTWTDQEIRYWLETRDKTAMTFAVTRWAADTVGEPLADLGTLDWAGPDLPFSLRGVFEEPLMVDLRWATDPSVRTLENEQFRDAIAEIAAAVRGQSKDEFIGAYVTMRHRARIITGAVALGLGILALALVLSSIIAIAANRAAASAQEDQAAAEEAERLADEATRLADEATAEAEAASSAADAAREAAIAGRDEALAETTSAQADKAAADAAAAQALEQQTAAEMAAAEAKAIAAEADAEAATAAAAAAAAEAKAADAAVTAAAAEAGAKKANAERAAAEAKAADAAVAAAAAEAKAADAAVAAAAAEAKAAEANAEQAAAETAVIAADAATARAKTRALRSLFEGLVVSPGDEGSAGSLCVEHSPPDCVLAASTDDVERTITIVGRIPPTVDGFPAFSRVFVGVAEFGSGHAVVYAHDRVVADEDDRCAATCPPNDNLVFIDNALRWAINREHDREACDPAVEVLLIPGWTDEHNTEELQALLRRRSWGFGVVDVQGDVDEQLECAEAVIFGNPWPSEFAWDESVVPAVLHFVEDGGGLLLGGLGWSYTHFGGSERTPGDWDQYPANQISSALGFAFTQDTYEEGAAIELEID